MPVPASATTAEHARTVFLDRLMRRHRCRPDALIEILHAAQERFGHLDRTTLARVAQGLALPPAVVYGVATFYHFFTLEPPGRHNCAVCRGTVCHLRGSDRILAAVEQRFGTTAGGTTADGELTVTAPRCVGDCILAPLVILDGQPAKQDSPDEAVAVVAAVLAGDTP